MRVLDPFGQLPIKQKATPLPRRWRAENDDKEDDYGNKQGNLFLRIKSKPESAAVAHYWP